MDNTSYSFERLEVWQDAMELVLDIYRFTKPFPDDERYNLVSQVRRAATSIPVNIAEGRGRFHKREQVQFFYNARGSLYEVVTLVKLATKLGYLNAQQHKELNDACQRTLSKLSGLINSLKAVRSSPSPFTLNPSPK